MPEATGPDQAIQLTYAGTAALAVVRLRGPGAAGFVARFFGRQTPTWRCVYGRWREEDGQVLDDVVVVRGEEWFDVNLHGGRRIVARLLEQAARAGFEVITGERAIAAAAEDEIEAALPLATTELGLRWLLGQPEAWRALDPARVDVEALLSDMTLRRLLYPATVAIVGPPNVGKSTLANALFGQERAIVADVPGTTRDWVGGLADLGGVPVVLVDTPGRRETADPIERDAIALSEGPVARADLVVLLSDPTQPDVRATGAFDAPPHPVSRSLERPRHHPLPAGEGARTEARLEHPQRPGAGATPASRCDAADGPGGAVTRASRGNTEEGSVPILQIANKCDLAEAPAGWLAISAKTGAGLAELIDAIHRGLGVDVSNAHRQIRANLWNFAQEKLLREGGARAVPQIAHRLGNW